MAAIQSRVGLRLARNGVWPIAKKLQRFAFSTLTRSASEARGFRRFFLAGASGWCCSFFAMSHMSNNRQTETGHDPLGDTIAPEVAEQVRTEGKKTAMTRGNVLSFAIAAILFSGSDCLVAAEPKADLWILSGQSNACGRGKLPGPESHPQALMFDEALGKFVTAKDPLPGMGTAGVGPWVAAAKLVATELNLPVRMCGYASGGKPIAYWHPGQPGHQGLFPVIQEAGQRADVFLWYQGENDSGGRLSTAEYRKELTEHVARVREAAGNPEMLAVIVQLGPALREGRSGYMAIREAQRQFVLADANAVLVPALGRTLKDSVHLDTAGYGELGREIGRAVLKVRHENPVGDWPGPVLDAAVLRPNDEARKRTTVVAHFAEVRELAHADASDFAVVDAEGTNRCRELDVGKTLVTLTVERDVVLPARLVYGFGTKPKASLTDEAGNRAPAVQLPITLGDPPKDSVATFPNG